MERAAGSRANLPHRVKKAVPCDVFSGIPSRHVLFTHSPRLKGSVPHDLIVLFRLTCWLRRNKVCRLAGPNVQPLNVVHQKFNPRDNLKPLDRLGKLTGGPSDIGAP